MNPLEVVVYDEYYVTISVVVMAFYLMVFYENIPFWDGVTISVAVMAFYLMVFYENIPFWDGVSEWFVQPIAEQLTILMIFTIMFTTQTFDYIIFKRKSNFYELYN